MKDQYVADFNDYLKYAILRRLGSVGDERLLVDWMLTRPDGRRDGGRTGYLTKPHLYRELDPPVFDVLEHIVASDCRRVSAVMDSGVLPSATFVADEMHDSLKLRRSRFEGVLHKVDSNTLTFFDPDNGIEVPSVAPGRRNSSKYVLWSELVAALARGSAVCTYQHFPRVQREPFMRTLLARLYSRYPGVSACCLHTSSVAYLLACRRAGSCLIQVAGQTAHDLRPHVAFTTR